MVIFEYNLSILTNKLLEQLSLTNSYISALDKLLGQLGIYTNWLSSIAYLQKQLRIFIFLRHIFFL